MRILHVLSRLNRGGAELRTLDLMRHIDRDRYQFEFCCTSGLEGELDDEAIKLGGRIHPIPFNLGFSKRFRALLRERRFDAVHSHLHHLSGYILRLAAREGVPVRIAHFRSTHDGHGNNLRRLLQRKILRHWLDCSATRILGVSGASLQDAWGETWRQDGRCGVIYNGIDSAQFAGAPDPVGVREEFGVPSGSALCIHVGRMDAAKNHTRLLQIFERVLRLQGDCYLILAGGGERGREQIARNEAAALGIAERVVFAGTRRDVPRLLGAADLMIFPSAWEGLPGAILEASATGTPVLASDLPCILEISERLTDVRCLSLSQADEVWAAAAVGMIAQGGAAGASERFELSQFSMSNCARAFEAMYGNSGPHSFEGAQPVTTLGLQNSFPAPGHGARMPSLDGLRAVAILLVLLGHLSGTRLFPGWLYHSTIFANLGVRIFFVLSGFLITTLLLDELRSRGQISLKRFYFRRSLRILPAFYAYILVVALLSAAGLWHVGLQELLHTATFVSDYDAYRPWQTGHAWSLAVEEQFYLLWPLLMALLGVGAAIRAAWFAVAFTPVLRIGIWHWAPEWRPLINSGFFTVCDALATGCLLACYRQRLGSAAYTRWTRSWWFIAVPAIALAANLAQHHTRSLPLSYALGQTAMNICIALCLDRAVRLPEDFCGRILNTPLLARMGVMSYSIYLWQQLFLNRNSDLWVCAFPMNMVFSIAAGSCSYYLVEKTFLRWRAATERKQAPVLSPETSGDARRFA